jgi:hypothetical protein
MVSMEVQIDPGSSQRGNGMTELYRLYITEMKGFELMDCLETGGLFVWNVNGSMILRSIEQIFEQRTRKTTERLDCSITVGFPAYNYRYGDL